VTPFHFLHSLFISWTSKNSKFPFHCRPIVLAIFLLISIRLHYWRNLIRCSALLTFSEAASFDNTPRRLRHRLLLTELLSPTGMAEHSVQHLASVSVDLSWTGFRCPRLSVHLRSCSFSTDYCFARLMRMFNNLAWILLLSILSSKDSNAQILEVFIQFCTSWVDVSSCVKHLLMWSLVSLKFLYTTRIDSITL